MDSRSVFIFDGSDSSGWIVFIRISFRVCSVELYSLSSVSSDSELVSDDVCPCLNGTQSESSRVSGSQSVSMVVSFPESYSSSDLSVVSSTSVKSSRGISVGSYRSGCLVFRLLLLGIVVWDDLFSLLLTSIGLCRNVVLDWMCLV